MPSVPPRMLVRPAAPLPATASGSGCGQARVRKMSGGLPASSGDRRQGRTTNSRQNAIPGIGCCAVLVFVLVLRKCAGGVQRPPAAPARVSRPARPAVSLRMQAGRHRVAISTVNTSFVWCPQLQLLCRLFWDSGLHRTGLCPARTHRRVTLGWLLGERIDFLLDKCWFCCSRA